MARKKRIKPKSGSKKNPWKVNPRQTKTVTHHLVRTKKGTVYIRGGYEHPYPKSIGKKEDKSLRRKKEEPTKPKTDKEMMLESAKEEVACRLGVGI